MDTSVIRAALVELQGLLEDARAAKNQIESAHAGRRIEGSYYEDPEAAFASILNDLYEILLVLLEAAGMPETRQRLLNKWVSFEKAGDIGRTTYDEQYDSLESKPFEYLSTLIDGLRVATGDALQPLESFELAKLEMILRNTSVLLHRRGITPGNEHDVQKVMHDYLRAFFTEYKSPVRISGIIRDFEPDGGIRNLRAAIEFKYAASKDEVSRALGGIFEDHNGYSGSHDRVRFYAVIYQTAPFESEDHVRSELTRAGMITWKAILVTGGGAHSRRGRTRRGTTR
jgi:hypothetical protein